MGRAPVLEPRDVEILRALLRHRYLTTSIIRRTFFVHDRVARRRLQKLAEAGLVRVHTRGLPPGSGGAWRLMGRGLDALARALPNEPIPPNLIDRVTEGSLHRLWKRQYLARIYFELVAPEPPRITGSEKVLECRRWALDVRRRADQITWQPKHDVVIRYSRFGSHYEILPETTVASPGRGFRVFIHVDWRPRRKRWVLDCLKAYSHFIGNGSPNQFFGDRLTPIVLYLVRTPERMASLTRQLRKVEGARIEWRVATRDQAAPWLAQQLLEPEFEIVSEEEVAA